MLTSDEKTVLMIAASGAPMIPIGRWEKPTKALIERGLMKPHPHPGDPTGHFNNYITDAGRRAMEDADHDEFVGLIEAAGNVQRAQHKLAAAGEKIAQDLAALARLSAELKVDPPQKALKKWSRVIVARAVAILEGDGA